MDSKELRIGNEIFTLSELDNSFIRVKVWSIYENLINGVELERFKPIPITEEWLLKFGFIEKDYESPDYSTTYYQKDEFLLDLDFKPIEFEL